MQKRWIWVIILNFASLIIRIFTRLKSIRSKIRKSNVTWHQKNWLFGQFNFPEPEWAQLVSRGEIIPHLSNDVQLWKFCLTWTGFTKSKIEKESAWLHLRHRSMMKTFCYISQDLISEKFSGQFTAEMNYTTPSFCATRKTRWEHLSTFLESTMCQLLPWVLRDSAKFRFMWWAFSFIVLNLEMEISVLRFA